MPDASLESKYAVFGDKNKSAEFTKGFSRFFKEIQLKTSSEQWAKLVGSLMNNISGKNRFLEPQNIDKEMLIVFNCPPIFILEDSFVDEITQKLLTKKFFKSCDSSRPSWGQGNWSFRSRLFQMQIIENV